MVVGRSCIVSALLQEAEQVPLDLGAAPPDGGQLDVALHALEVAPGLPQHDDAPAEVGEDLPVAQEVGPEPPAAHGRVAVEEPLLRAERALARMIHTAPVPETHPAEVLAGVAQGRPPPPPHAP